MTIVPAVPPTIAPTINAAPPTIIIAGFREPSAGSGVGTGGVAGAFARTPTVALACVGPKDGARSTTGAGAASGAAAATGTMFGAAAFWEALCAASGTAARSSTAMAVVKLR
jgi:hypothetical protein